MRLSFLQQECAEYLVPWGETTIGAAPDNTVILKQGNIPSKAILLRRDARGLVLRVGDVAAKVYINGRPIQQMGFLRCGDLLCLGTVRILIKTDHDAAVQRAGFVPPLESLRLVPELHSNTSPALVHLRGLTGIYFGQAIAVIMQLQISNQEENNLFVLPIALDFTVKIVVMGNEIYLYTDCVDGSVVVNGVSVTQQILLFAEDQLCVGNERFLIEAPSFITRDQYFAGRADSDAEEISAENIKMAVQLAQEHVRTKQYFWILISVAAFLALVITILFIVH